MKLFQLIINVLVNTYFSSADPNLFGSKARRTDKERVANEYKAMATDTQSEINQAKIENPFESAGAKAAMAKASQGAKAMETRMFNTMGAGATPEAIVGVQGATNQAIGSTAGEIAAGAEANKNNKIATLQGLKTQQMGMYGSESNAASSERGSGWNTLFQGINALGNVTSSVGQSVGAFKTKGATPTPA